jgi:hypothetical protein
MFLINMFQYFIALSKNLYFESFYCIFPPQKYAFVSQGFRENSDLGAKVPWISRV